MSIHTCFFNTVELDKSAYCSVQMSHNKQTKNDTIPAMVAKYTGTVLASFISCLAYKQCAYRLPFDCYNIPVIQEWHSSKILRNIKQVKVLKLPRKNILKRILHMKASLFISIVLHKPRFPRRRVVGKPMPVDLSKNYYNICLKLDTQCTKKKDLLPYKHTDTDATRSLD